ncbi:MAG TPA: PAS domain S-box protein [Dehalococcoidia bacterium]|nr:PAS domain S-box protein [Dehalococcoidia bacterium]
MEKGIELTEQDYRYLFENASDAMWVHDRRGTFLDGNKAFEKLSGYTLEEWIGKSITEFLSDESLAQAREVRQKLLNGEEVEQPYEQQFILKDGTARIVKMATSPVIINGELTGFQHVARDVTEEKRAEEMLSNIIDGSPIATFVIDRQHRVTHWNTAIESLSGVGSQEVLGTDRHWQAFYKEKRPTMADLIVEGASADKIEEHYQGKYQKSRLIDGAYEAKDFFASLGKDGKWLRFTASPIESERGELIAAIETLQDITEEKQLQDNMHFYVQLITRAQEEERKRIARELHDDVSPSLLLLIQRLDALALITRPKLSRALKEGLEDLRSQAVVALEGLRRCAQDLSPRILDDLGLEAALEWMAEDMVKNQGIATHVDVTGTKHTLPMETQLLLFRIGQEALSNIRRHSGASIATVKLEFESGKVRMTISDNGKGFELPNRTGDLAGTGKLGIIGMYERAHLVNGYIDIQSEPGRGTRVITEVPL